MFKWLKQALERWQCNHEMSVNRWHWVHYPNYEPRSIEIEYKCSKCGNLSYLHLKGKDAKEWSDAMGNHKKV